MKKLLAVIAITVALFTIGCGSIQVYTDAGQSFDARVNEEFVLALGSNPTTGYSWQEKHDEGLVKLVERKYVAGEAGQGVAGAGGVEYFRFKALKPGETTIAFVYKRAWENDAAAQKTFIVRAK